MYSLSSQQLHNICCFVPEISCDWIQLPCGLK